MLGRCKGTGVIVKALGKRSLWEGMSNGENGLVRAGRE